MKKRFTFFLVVLFSNFIYSQNELVQFGVWNREVFKKNTNEYLFISSGKINLFNKNIVPYSQIDPYLPSISGIFPGQNNSTIISGAYVSDVIFPVLKKFDEGWNEVLEVYTSHSGKYGGELQDGTVFYAGYTYMEAFDPFGNFLWEVYGNGGETTDTYVTEGDTIVWVTEKGLYLYSATGQIISTFPNYSFNHTVPVSNHQWVGQKKDSLFLLSPSFDEIAKTSFPNVEVLDMEAEYGKIALLTKDSMIYIFDESLVLQNSFELNGANLNFYSNFEIVEEGLIVAGGTYYGENDYGTFFKKYLWDGTNAYTENNDVGILSADLGDSASIVPYVVPWAGINKDTLIKLTFFNPVFTVENFGETTIGTITINTFFPYVYAGLYEFLVTFNGKIRLNKYNVAIGPGEVKDITLSSISFYFYDNPTGDLYDLCFWTSQPNFKVDDHPTNDTHCFQMVVATKEELENNIAVSVFPNPSNGTFKISVGDMQAKNAEWILYDQFGRQQLIMPLHIGQSEFDVSLPHLPTGIYFWKIKTDRGISGSGRLIIQR